MEWVDLFFVEAFSPNARTRRASGSSTTQNESATIRALGRRRRGGEHGDAARAGCGRIADRPGLHSATERGHGYGSAVTAAAADLAHRSGTPDVVLFADLANPTSNAIYQRIGFEPVVDSVRIDFGTLG